MAELQAGPGIGDVEIGSVFSALAHPARRHIVQVLLTKGDWTAETCSSFNLSLSKSSLTHHVKVMCDAGLITQVDYGNRCEVTLRHSDLQDRFPGLLDLVRSDALAGMADHG